MKNQLAILLVSFGSTNLEAKAKTLDILEDEVRTEFPDAEVRHAYTSPTIRRILRDRNNIKTASLDEALECLVRDGFKRVICQPTYVINGFEYDDMISSVEKYRKEFESIVCGLPLMTDFACDQLADSLAGAIGIHTDDTVLFVGHGSAHTANVCYARLEEVFHRKGYNNLVVGTIEGTPSLDDVLDKFEHFENNKLILTPLLTVAGVHAAEDIFGEEESWMSEMTGAGFIVIPLRKGLCEYAEVRNILITSLRDCMVKKSIVS